MATDTHGPRFARTPFDGGKYWGDDDPERRVCRHYNGGVVWSDGVPIGPRTCRAGVEFTAAGVDLGDMILALPCTHEIPPCALREWGPRRREGQACADDGESGEDGSCDS